jgi:TolB-like protein
MTAANLKRWIDVAREPSFDLGAASIRPASCEVAAAGKSIRLQPRVMQVLVALARTGGELVTRDSLVESCWDGVAVSDDAINRCIQRLRRLAEHEAPRAFVIETVPRVGYRLTRSPASVAASAARGEDILLAVLPFENLSGDEGMVYFSDGVSEEILHTVSRRAALRVIGRSSSFSFRGADKSAKNVARELGATHLLDGSVRRNGNLVRVSVELVECAGQTSMWAHRFDRDLSDILALQDDIAAAVAAALRIRFGGAPAVQKIDAAAYDLFLQAHPGVNRGSVPPSRAIAILERVVSLAPDFAPAWAELAQHRAVAYRGLDLDVTPVTVHRAEVIVAAERALQLDPECGFANIALGLLLPWGDYVGREAAFEQAALAAGTSTEATRELGWFLATVGRNQDALRAAAEGLALDPLNARVANLYSQMLCATGRYEESRRAFADFRARWPDWVIFVNVPLVLAAAVGDWPEMDGLVRIAEQRHRSNPYMRPSLQRAATLRNPSPRRREKLLELLHTQVSQDGAVDLALLTLAHRIGLTEEVFALIDKAFFPQMRAEDGPQPARGWSPGIIFDRSTNLAMIEDPRFVGLCAKLGLCDYWSRTERWPDCAEYGVVDYDFKAEARRLAKA